MIQWRLSEGDCSSFKTAGGPWFRGCGQSVRMANIGRLINMKAFYQVYFFHFFGERAFFVGENNNRKPLYITPLYYLGSRPGGFLKRDAYWLLSQ